MTAGNVKDWLSIIYMACFITEYERMFERYRRILLALVVLARVSESLKYDIITNIRLSHSLSSSFCRNVFVPLIETVSR